MDNKMGNSGQSGQSGSSVLEFGLKLEYPAHVYIAEHMHIQIQLLPDFLECNYCKSQGASVLDYMIL
jgi:hypothetical protein